MKKEAEIMEYLKQNLSKKRLKHSIGVSDTARMLALHYGCDPDKAELAGLLHDCAREKTMAELIQYVRAEGIEPDEMSMSMRELLHGPAAVYICRKTFNINDEEVLSAIRYHTIGKVNMTLLEKIIFLADYIEPSRDFKGVKKLRDLAYSDLDGALLAAFDSTIEYILAKKAYIHIDTIAARNYLLLAMEKDS